jgi:hypothetical protein
MNSFERKKLKREQASKNNWKQKAMDRNNQLRKANLKIRDLTKSREIWKQEAMSLRREREQNSLPALSSPPLQSQELYFIMVSLCINLTINCSVSFRSIPKILAAFGKAFELLGLPFQLMIPHFTTVINWTLRVGCHLLQNAVQPIVGSWICIIDHTIQVGTKKAFVVLKVPVESLASYGSLTLKDVEVLYLKVQEKCNGVILKDLLGELFQTVGYPIQIVLDGGPDLNKAVRLLAEGMSSPIKITYDLTHLIASLLKKKYSSHELFNQITSQMAQTKNKLQQTVLSFLIPLKERSKSRFLNLPSIAKWTKHILFYLKRLSSQAQDNERLSQIMTHLSWLFDYLDFLEIFWIEIKALTDIQKLLKNRRLDELTYKEASRLLDPITDPDIRNPLFEYLQIEYEYAQNALSLLTSDIIESLFGKYKNIVKPHSFSEINRMILTLPCITEDISPELVKEAFADVRIKDLQRWIEEEISETLLSKRRKALSNEDVQKKPPAQIINFPNHNADNTHLYDGQKSVGTASALG